MTLLEEEATVRNLNIIKANKIKLISKIYRLQRIIMFFLHKIKKKVKIEKKLKIKNLNHLYMKIKRYKKSNNG